MTGRDTTRSDLTVPAEVESSWRRAMWRVQGAGLAVVTALSFFPGLSHGQEYLFLALFAIALGALAMSGEGRSLRTPLDLPLGLFVGWVLLSVPFATDPAYSFTEWRKLGSHVLIFYWAMAVLRAQPNAGAARAVLVAEIGRAHV